MILVLIPSGAFVTLEVFCLGDMTFNRVLSDFLFYFQPIPSKLEENEKYILHGSLRRRCAHLYILFYPKPK